MLRLPGRMVHLGYHATEKRAHEAWIAGALRFRPKGIENK